MKQLTLLALLLATAVLASCSVKDPMRLDQMKISDPDSPGGSTYVTVWRDMKTKRDFY